MTNPTKKMNGPLRLHTSLLAALTSVMLAAPNLRADYESTVLGDQPIAYYALSLTNSTEVDLSGNGNDGTYVNIAPGYNNVPGPSAYITNGVSFDGLTTYVDLSTGSNPGLLNFGGAISMEAWVQSASTSGNGYILGKGYDSANNANEIVLRCPGFGVYEGGTYNNTAGNKHATGGTVTTDWAHVVCANDGTNWNLYVNGAKVATAADSVGALNWAAPWAIGNGTVDGGTRIFTGNISQVALYTNALTANQVLKHYYMGIYGTTDVAPVITVQPQSQVAAPGATVSFNYQAQSVLPVTNLWFKNGSPLSNQTNTTLTLSNVQTASAGGYSVVVGNSAGSVTSVVANLTVKSVGIYGFSPVALTAGSYNQDIIVEKGALVAATTATMDSGTDNRNATWFESGYYGSDLTIGLPAAGSTFVSATFADHFFGMAPSYATNDAVFLSGSVANATLTATTPASYSTLSFLGSAAYGDTTINYTVHHADNTTESGNFITPDWFGSGSLAMGVGGRVDAATRGTQIWSAGSFPYIFSTDIALANTTSPVTSIDLSFNSGGNACLLAVSGSTGGNFNPIGVTGYNKDMIVEAGAQHFNGGTYTTVSVDNGTANTQYSWYETGYSTTPSFAAGSGVPAAGSVITSVSESDHHYKLAPSYTGNNVAYVDASTSDTVTFATPATVWAISFLTAAGHGPVNVNYVVHHADSTTETGTFVSKDWFTSSPVVWAANGRVDVGNGGLQTFGNVPCLLSADIGVTNITSPVTSIDLSYGTGNSSGSLAAVYGVSAAYMSQAHEFTSIQKSPGGSATLNFSGVPGYQYIGQFTPSLNPPTWQNIGTNVANSSGLWQLIDSGATNHSNGFYRALYLP